MMARIGSCERSTVMSSGCSIPIAKRPIGGNES
jgi:hypothetical protein